MSVRRITKDAIFLALMCITGMFAIPMGDNIKVSLQFLILIIIFGLADNLFDRILIPALYLLIGLIAPIYAGFMAGVTPTFGFVIAFVVSAIPFHFLFKYLLLNFYIKYVLAALSSLLVVYAGGVIFMKFYLGISFETTLLISVIPYLPFDAAKILTATLVIKLLPDSLKKIK